MLYAKGGVVSGNEEGRVVPLSEELGLLFHDIAFDFFLLLIAKVHAVHGIDQLLPIFLVLLLLTQQLLVTVFLDGN